MRVSSFPRNRCLSRCRETAHRASSLLWPSVVSVSMNPLRRRGAQMLTDASKACSSFSATRGGGPSIPCPLAARPCPHIWGGRRNPLPAWPRRWLPMPDVVGCPGDETRARAESQGLPVLPAVRNGAAGGVCCLPGPSPVSRVGRHVALQLRHCLQRVRPPFADQTPQARQQIWSGSDQIGLHRGTQEHPQLRLKQSPGLARQQVRTGGESS